VKRDAPRQTRLRLDTPVTYLKGVGPARAEALKRLGVLTAGDLLYHIPHRYEDASTISTIASLETGMQGTVVGRVVSKGVLQLPVQDCTRTYGGGVRLLQVRELKPDRFEAEAQGLLAPPPQAGAYRAGLHTLSACGDHTLIDVKRIDRSARGLVIALQRRLGRS